MNTDLLDQRLLSPTLPPRHVFRPYLLMLVSSATFATMGACTHGLNGRCDWRIVTICRAGLAFVLTLWIARAHGSRLQFWRPRTLWMRSLVGSFSMVLSFYALAELPVSTAYTLFNTFPLWVTLLAWPVLRERPTAGVALALVSAILGVFLIEQPHAGEVRAASLAALAASVCTAIVMLGLHRLRHLDALAIVVHFSGVATVTAVAFAALTATAVPLDLSGLFDPVALLLLAGVGLCATLGQIAMTRAFSGGPPQKLSIIGLTQVVFALGFDRALWGRTQDALSFAGMMLIIAPVAWLIGRRPRPQEVA